MYRTIKLSGNSTLLQPKRNFLFRINHFTCNFWHLGTFTLKAERQSARMSKITNDGLTRSGTGCFIAVTIRQ